MSAQEIPDPSEAEVAAKVEADLAEVSLLLNGIDRDIELLTEFDALAFVILELRDIKRQADEAFKRAKSLALGVMGEKVEVVEGIGIFEAMQTRKYTNWDHERLWERVTALALDERKFDPETGELLEREADTIARVLRECCRPDWRLTPLRARGISVDEYATVSEGTYDIKLPSDGGRF